MEQNTENPFNLAQYVLLNPSGRKDWQFYDASPVLEPLSNHLRQYLIEEFSTEEGRRKLCEKPGSFLKVMAERADEFYTSRTASDLVAKAMIVDKITQIFFEAMSQAIFPLRGSSSHLFELLINVIKDKHKPT